MKKQILGAINRIGERLPKRVQRTIADFPGVLTLLGKLGSGVVEDIHSPEGYLIEINTLFHSNLVKSGSLENYETNIRKAITRLTRPGFTAYDVGANVGVFSFLFLSLVGPKGRVYAFEPEPNNNECLGHSIAKSGARNIILDNRAVGDAIGVASFDRRGGAFSGRLVSNNTNYSPTDNVIEVKTTTLDTLVNEENYSPPDILKIDVEGNEGLVLSGMSKILEDHAPIIICELHGHLGDSVDKVGEILRKNNYFIYAIQDYLDLPADNLAELSSLRNIGHIVALSGRTG